MAIRITNDAEIHRAREEPLMVRGEVEKFSGVRALDGNLTSKEKINIFYN